MPMEPGPFSDEQRQALSAFGIDDLECLLAMAEVPDALPWLGEVLGCTPDELPARLAALAGGARALPPVDHPLGLREDRK